MPSTGEEGTVHCQKRQIPPPGNQRSQENLCPSHQHPALFPEDSATILFLTFFGFHHLVSGTESAGGATLGSSSLVGAPCPWRWGSTNEATQCLASKGRGRGRGHHQQCCGCCLAQGRLFCPGPEPELLQSGGAVFTASQGFTP